MDWRSWSAADWAGVTFLLWERMTSDPLELRELYELVGDKNAVAALDRENMGQTSRVEVPDIPVRR